MADPARLISDHVVIIGAGFGGLEAARQLGRADIPTTIVDRHNYHLFQPLLYQVATAALSPADIAEPIRTILRPYPSVVVLLGDVVGFDLSGRRIALAEGPELRFDHLIVATGASYGYFGNQQWASYAPGLKTIEDARRIRSKLLVAFEQAEAESDPDLQQSHLTFVIIGGGPTGVEMAGAIAELSRYALARDFRRIRPASARIVLIEAGPRILSAFPKRLADYAAARLERLGVSILMNTPVEDIRSEMVVAGGQRIPAGCIVWAAGVVASGAGVWLGADTDRAGRVRVAPNLSVPGLDHVFVIGDVAHATDAHGAPLPGLAQVAKQQGHHLGRALARRLQTGETIPPFVFKNRGNAAIVGRHAAVFDFGRWTFSGMAAWVLWGIVHVYLLVSFRNRLSVSVQWLWRYLTFQRGARIITDSWREPERISLQKVERAGFDA